MPVVVGTGYEYSLSEVRLKVRHYLLQTDTDETTWPETVLNTYIADTLNDMKLRGIETLAQNAFTSVAGEQFYVLPATAWKVFAVNYDDTWLQQISHYDMDKITGGDWDAGSGTPEFWFDDRDDVNARLYFDKEFGESGKTVRFWYWKRPQDATEDDETLGYNKVFGPIIVAGAVARAHMADGNLEEYQAWQQNYLDLVQDGVYHSRKLHEADALVVSDPYS